MGKLISNSLKRGSAASGKNVEGAKFPPPPPPPLFLHLHVCFLSYLSVVTFTKIFTSHFVTDFNTVCSYHVEVYFHLLPKSIVFMQTIRLHKY